MFKPLLKKQKLTHTTKGAQVICDACGYTRKKSDSNPTWQCPNCHSAYIKVDKQKSVLTQSELKKKNKEFLAQRKKGMHGEIEINIGKFGLGAGIITFLKGMGSACAAANPLLLTAGAVVAAVSLGYLLSKLSGIWF